MLKMAQIKGAENLLVYSRFSLSHLLPRCGHSTFLNLSDQVPFHLMILKGELLSVMMHERCMFLLDMKQISSLLLHCFIMRTFDVSLCAGGASAFGLMFLHWARKHLWFQHFLDQWYQLVMWTACLYGMYCLCWLLHNAHNVLYTMDLTVHLLKHPPSEDSLSPTTMHKQNSWYNAAEYITARSNVFGILSTCPLSGFILVSLSGRAWINSKNHRHVVNNDFNNTENQRFCNWKHFYSVATFIRSPW